MGNMEKVQFAREKFFPSRFVALLQPREDEVPREYVAPTYLSWPVAYLPRCIVWMQVGLHQNAIKLSPLVADTWAVRAHARAFIV